MNHDYAHCLDYTKDCPKECFRAELQRDIEENRSVFIGVPLAYSHLGSTVECKQAIIEEVSEECQEWHGSFIRCKKNAQPEIKPINYQDCSNALLRMWMDNVITDGEYWRIMDKLNAHWGKKDE